MKGKFVKSALFLAAAGLMAFAPASFAHGWGYGGGYRGGYYGGYHGGYYGRGHYDHAGRWVAGALVAGAVAGLVYSATRPSTNVYYDRPVYYSRPATTVIYDDGPAYTTRRVTTTTTTYDDGYTTRYVRDDGYGY